MEPQAKCGRAEWEQRAEVIGTVIPFLRVFPRMRVWRKGRLRRPPFWHIPLPGDALELTGNSFRMNTRPWMVWFS